MGLRIVNGVPYFDGKTSNFPNGTRACSMCLRLPARTVGGKAVSYCRRCATEANRKSRKGKVSMLVTPEERLLLRELRQAVPAGRHHARGLQ